ncbi:hypothetical protein CAPTEDRAFT_211851 [Capitella teleta]|uniref:Uncharacterized protein n=1 Tax=Capitella teleta TaxID=283909 RepID=R7U4V7_CAPTE|nr:hypothetical protein CAPTEDRAFT_211851 [Capitella teleta]|eukprot:ELU01395.1 hypothetical protein CAPTEDRAFT_211851 [Capitella teleta]
MAMLHNLLPPPFHSRFFPKFFQRTAVNIHYQVIKTFHTLRRRERDWTRNMADPPNNLSALTLSLNGINHKANNHLCHNNHNACQAECLIFREVVLHLQEHRHSCLEEG